MNMNEATLVLKLLGWSIHTDEVGDKVARFKLPDRVVSIIYGLDLILQGQKFGVILSLTTDAFSQACSEIRGKHQSCYPLVRAWMRIDIRAPEILEDDVRQTSDEAITWAKNQDLDKALQEHSMLPTDAPGARPIWHLAALALSGDVAKLKTYQASFEAGDRLGFVPYVTKDFIDRAVALAEDHATRS